MGFGHQYSNTVQRCFCYTGLVKGHHWIQFSSITSGNWILDTDDPNAKFWRGSCQSVIVQDIAEDWVHLLVSDEPGTQYNICLLTLILTHPSLIKQVVLNWETGIGKMKKCLLLRKIVYMEGLHFRVEEKVSNSVWDQEKKSFISQC